MYIDTALKNIIPPKPAKIILVAVLIMIFFILLAMPVNAYERPEYKDGLENNWHPGSFCIPCHYTLLGNERASSISTGCTKTCHAQANWPKDSKSKYFVDITKISKIHKEILCIKCHVGSKSGINVTAVDFHMVMSKTDCMECHTYVNGTYMKPEKTRCSDCHAGDPHVVHGNRLEKMCVACHGKFGENYVNNSGGTNEKLKLSSPLNASRAKTLTEYPTLGQFMSKIIESIMQILR